MERPSGIASQIQNQENQNKLDGKLEEEFLRSCSIEAEEPNSPYPHSSTKLQANSCTEMEPTVQHRKWAKIILSTLVILLLEVLTILGCINFYLIYSGSVVAELREENTKLHSTVNILLENLRTSHQLELEMQDSILEIKNNQERFLNCSDELDDMKRQHRTDLEKLLSLTNLLVQTLNSSHQEHVGFAKESQQFRQSSSKIMTETYQLAHQIAQADGKLVPTEQSFYTSGAAANRLSNPFSFSTILIVVFAMSAYAILFH